MLADLWWEVSQSEKKVLIMEHVALGMKVKDALEKCDLTRHQYYYKQKGTKQGPAPSEVTCNKKGDIIEEVDNKEFVKLVEENHSDPDLSYGYHKMTKELQLLGYYINKKKVYRLMDENKFITSTNKGYRQDLC